MPPSTTPHAESPVSPEDHRRAIVGRGPGSEIEADVLRVTAWRTGGEHGAPPAIQIG